MQALTGGAKEYSVVITNENVWTDYYLSLNLYNIKDFQSNTVCIDEIWIYDYKYEYRNVITKVYLENG